MGFESMVDVTTATTAPTSNVVDPTNVNANVTEALALKVSHGNEMRRASFIGNAFVALRELVSKMFEIDQASIVLKYQDEDGDLITMSSDAELQEAIQLAKQKNLLRVFAELKSSAPTPAPREAEQDIPTANKEPFGPCRRGFGRYARGMHHGPHDFHHGFAQQGPHGFYHQGRGGFRGGFQYPRGGAHFYGQFGPVNTPLVPPSAPGEDVPAPTPAPTQAGGPSGNFHTPHVFAHGVFSSMDAPTTTHYHGTSPYPPRSAFKEHMKEHIKLMKSNATTPEDFEVLKMVKQQMKEEWKANWQAAKEYKKDMKNKDKCYKKEKKDECRKEHKEYKKLCKEAKNRFVAKHVADITVPDNCELPADTPVTKIWRMRNGGAVAWPIDSQLVFISRRGDNLNGPERVFVGTVEAQQEVDVSVTFITPSEPGRYIGYYRMANGEGIKFGQRVWVSFIIAAAGAGAAMNAPNDVPPVTTTTSSTTTFTTVNTDMID